MKIIIYFWGLGVLYAKIQDKDLLESLSRIFADVLLADWSNTSQIMNILGSGRPRSRKM
jgi:hypothetical protein